MSTVADEQVRQVAVVVFAECDGISDRDAENGAMLAIRQLLNSKMGLPVEIPGRGASGEFTVNVVEVIPLRWATGDGYLKVTPTNRAFREHAPHSCPASQKLTVQLAEAMMDRDSLIDLHQRWIDAAGRMDDWRERDSDFTDVGRAGLLAQATAMRGCAEELRVILDAGK